MTTGQAAMEPGRDAAAPHGAPWYLCAEHLHAWLSRHLYENLGLQSAYAGRTQEGPVPLPYQFVTTFHGRGASCGQLLIRANALEGWDGDPAPGAPGKLAELARALSQELAEAQGCVAAVQPVYGAHRWPSREPVVDFLMFVGASPLEVRIWAP